MLKHGFKRKSVLVPALILLLVGLETNARPLVENAMAITEGDSLANAVVLANALEFAEMPIDAKLELEVRRIAIAALRAQQLPGVAKLAERAISLAAARLDKGAVALIELAWAEELLRQSRFNEAFAHGQKALVNAIEAHAEQSTIDAQLVLGSAAQVIGRYDFAFDVLEQARTALNHTPADQRYLHVLLQFSSLQERIGHYKEADKFIVEGLRWSEKTQARELQIRFLLAHARVHQLQGKLIQQEQALLAADKLHQQIESPEIKVALRLAQAAYRLQSKDFSAALVFGEEARKISESKGLLASLALCYEVLGNIYAGLGQQTETLSNYRRSKSLFLELGDYQQAIRVIDRLLAALKKSSDPAMALVESELKNNLQENVIQSLLSFTRITSSGSTNTAAQKSFPVIKTSQPTEPIKKHETVEPSLPWQGVSAAVLLVGLATLAWFRRG